MVYMFTGNKNAEIVLRKLQPDEHDRARILYEEVFSEDEKRFVDYYFQWKTRDNRIYVAENEDGIQASVHLNPFQMYCSGQIRRLHYIVAVATREAYRHQGLMRRLLAMAEEDMMLDEEPLTFLMPASEQIYLPFGFRYFAWQRRGILWTDSEHCGKTSGYRCRPVEKEEYQQLADFANEELKKQYELFVWRDRAYYERLCAEQQCQGGAVMIIVGEDDQAAVNCQETEQGGNGKKKILGTFCTAWEDASAPILREIILEQNGFAKAYEALLSYVNMYGSCKVEGCQKELPLCEAREYPLLMGKIPGQGIFDDIPDRNTVFINEVV